jgi:hypothetical protein
MQTISGACSRRLAALLALASLGYAASTTTPSAQRAPLLSVTSPQAGAKLTGQSMLVEIQIQPEAIRNTLAAALNGKDITGRFTVKAPCRGAVCTETALLTQADGLIKGQNVLRMRIKGWGANTTRARVVFAWSPGNPTGVNDGDISALPQPNYNFTTLTPGGYRSTGEPWFQISSNGLHGVTRTYPAQPPLCGGRGYTYTLVQIDRNNLNEVATTCLNTPDVDAALKAVPSTQFAVFGTNSTYNADWQNLNTLPIGGTDFRGNAPSAEVPYGYMVLGIGKAAYGVAMESYNTGYEVNETSLTQIQGALTRNGHSLFDYHPVDYITYSIDGPNKRATFDGQRFTVPSAVPTTGFWVFPFTRNTFAPLAGTQGVVYDATKAADLTAMNTLLGNLTWRQMAVVIGWGKQPGLSLPQSLNPLVTTLASMGVPYTTIQQMTTDQSAMAALVTPDPTVAIALPNRRVPFSMTPSDNGQTGQLVGSLGRDKYYLFRSMYTAQADLSSSSPIDASFLKTIWLPNSAWPMMDSTSRVNAYKYLSNRILHVVWPDKLPAGPTDDIRYIYTSAGASLLTKVNPDADPAFAYPVGGTYTNPDTGESYAFTESDLTGVAQQLRAEFGALAQVLPFLGTSTTGANLLGRLIENDNAWMPAWVTSNTITLNQSPWVNQSGSIGFSFDDLVYQSSALTPNQAAQGNPLFAPIEGMLGGLVIAVGSTGAMDVNNNGVPTAGYAVNATIKDFVFNYVTWVGNADRAYDQIMDLAVSDWNRLQILSLAIKSKWFLDDYTVLDHSPTLQLGANRFFYTTFMRTYYSHDAYWFTSTTDPLKVGSMKEECSFGSCTPQCRGVYTDSPTPNSSTAFSSFPPNGKYDLFQIATPIKDNESKLMTVQTPGADLGLMLFGTEQANGQFAMPKDVWFTMGALPIRSGADSPQYGYGGCVLP